MSKHMAELETLPAEVWLGVADFEQVAAGDIVKAQYFGLTMVGMAHHQRDWDLEHSGGWFTAEGGLLLPPIGSVRFQIMIPTVDVETLEAAEGTIVWAVTGAFEGPIEFRGASWWRYPADRYDDRDVLVWAPGMAPMHLTEWKLIRGEVRPA